MENKEGVIILLDILGTKRNWEEDEIHDINEKMKYLIDACKKNSVNFTKFDRNVELKTTIEFISFSDTLAFVIFGSKEVVIRRSGLLSSYLMKQALDKNIFIRGTISFGRIFYNPEYKIFLGPTIDEAAHWYDKGQTIGIYASPSVNFLLDLYKDHPSKNNIIKNVFLKHSFNLKTGGFYHCWMALWPIMMAFRADKLPNNSVKDFLKEYRPKIIDKFATNQGSNEYFKYENILRFYDTAIATYK